MSLFDLLTNIGNKITNPISNYANSVKAKATTLNPNPKLSELLFGQKIGTDDIDYSGLKGVDKTTPEYRESMGLSEDEPDPMVNISISNPQRYGGLFNDITQGYKENRFNPISIDNFQDNDLEMGRKKGFAYRLGEGLGTLGRIAESPLGRGLLTGAAIGMLGGNPAQVLTYGTVSGASNQSNRSKDALYRQQLAKEGIDTSNIVGYINDNTYESMLKAKQLRDNAEYRNAYLESQRVAQNEAREDRKLERELKREENAANRALTARGQDMSYATKLADLDLEREKIRSTKNGDADEYKTPEIILKNIEDAWKETPQGKAWKGTSKGKAIQTGVNNFFGISNNKVSAYMALKESMVTPLARTISKEKGNVSDADIKRARAMLPSEFDSYDQGMAKINAIRKLIGELKKGSANQAANNANNIMQVGNYTIEVE